VLRTERRASDATAEGEPLTIKNAAAALGLAASTLHRLLNAGFLPASDRRPALRGAFA
jgi:hypothetical protein